ncbi:DUF779 domain-containing protein [Deinococcus antarcticus]|uniref:DUF779 domain-containing protein n=1 Tax=Deinococcus antarcticus TaxID=1298767 RepID=A0ABV8A5A1_9DEIO
MPQTVSRVDITDAARALLLRLEAQHGPLMFHQSGGCCDGSSPMCYPRGEFRVGASDVRLGAVAGTPFYMSASQFEYWKHTHLTVDVVPGRGSGFSVEAPEGVRFLIRSRLFTDDEAEHLAPVEAGG